MEPNLDEILREKIWEVENKHAEWDRNKVLNGLSFSPKPKKKKVIFYYPAAASLLFIFLLQFNWDTKIPSYQARLEKVKTTMPIDTVAPKIFKTDPKQNLVATVQPKNIDHKMVTKEKTLQKPALEQETELPLVNNTPSDAPKFNNAAISSPTKEEIVTRKKIEPIIGIAYKEEIKSKIQKAISFQFEIGKQHSTNTIADNTAFAVLKTTLN